MILPIILCGGSGTRLWPLSRRSSPKQFLKLTSENSLLQETVLRVKGPDFTDPVLVCNEEHRFLVTEQLNEINSKGRIILEPCQRNTAPPITIGALLAQNQYENCSILVLSSDHFIDSVGYFQKQVKSALALCEEGKLITFGIKPSRAHTGYGYIKKGSKYKNSFQIDKFVEKPNEDNASIYFYSGDYLWNSGIFLFDPTVFLNELKKYCPEVYRFCSDAYVSIKPDLNFFRLDSSIFSNSPNISVDYAVMENTHEALVVPFNDTWSDVGDWNAIWDIREKDENGNVIIGDVQLSQSSNNFISSTSRLVATVGMNDCIIVETPDAVLISEKKSVQNVKEIVNNLQLTGRKEHLIGKEIFKPWGSYQTLNEGDNFYVRRVFIKPGLNTSLQFHRYRSEHWVVVSGKAEVRKNDDLVYLEENQSIFIPPNCSHSIANLEKLPLVIIEVSTGPYLEENDIVRL